MGKTSKYFEEAIQLGVPVLYLEGNKIIEWHSQKVIKELEMFAINIPKEFTIE